MPSSNDPFGKSDYLSGSTATASIAAPPKLPIGADLLKPQTKGGRPPSGDYVVEQSRYGSGKPRRVVIRGKITRE